MADLNKRELVETGDGSHSLYVPDLDEQYHSRHGAIQESEHVFLDMGLRRAEENGPDRLRILEIGFGTGLNALLTLLRATVPVEYVGIEKYPVQVEEAAALNYTAVLGGVQDMEWLHATPWEDWNQHPEQPFRLKKQNLDFFDIALEEPVDLIYFDAFAPNKQPELWTEEMFAHMAELLHPGGILTTYCAKGAVRRALQSVGLKVARLPGPPGKREMLRAELAQSEKESEE